MMAYQCAHCEHVQEPVDGKCPFCGTEGPPQKLNRHLRDAMDEIDGMREKNVIIGLDGGRHEFDPNLDRD